MEDEFELDTTSPPPPRSAPDPFAAETDAFIAEADARLKAIEAALGDLERGSYGRCEICGEPIGEERLAARASERRCAEHAATAGPAPRLF
jgi:RNA polymerase-binding transcription factor DksA